MAFPKRTPCPTPFSDHVVKSPEGVDVGVRVWPAEGKKNAPWLFWVHGGGWTAGHHNRGAPWMHAAFGSRGFHIVSVAYRFCPQVTFDEQIADVADAWAWCHSSLPSILSAASASIDLAASVVGGDSAGGFHTLYAGLTFSPAPRVLVPLYAPSDFFAMAAAPPVTPKPGQPVDKGVDKFPTYRERTEDEYKDFFAERRPDNARTFSPWWWDLGGSVEEGSRPDKVAELRSYFGLPDWTPSEEDYRQMDMYKYLSKNKVRFPVVFRKDLMMPEVYHEAIRKVNPMDILQTKETYPPTYLLHGDIDGAVHVSQSETFKKALEAKGVPVELVVASGGVHGFDVVIDRPTDEGWKEYIEPMIAFVDKHLKA